eukprot:g2554.t1
MSMAAAPGVVELELGAGARVSVEAAGCLGGADRPQSLSQLRGATIAAAAEYEMTEKPVQPDSAAAQGGAARPGVRSSDHLGFKINAETMQVVSAKPKSREDVLAAAQRGIGKPVFALSNPKSAADFNAYREQYRAFRVGNARGAKGEVSQFAHSSPVSMPHIVPPFLTKLYDMVTSSTYTKLIHWSEDGTAIVISNIKQFSQNVLPQYFKHSKFASFLRQLNMYNFYTTRQEPQLREFKNPFFIRDNVNLMSNIKRKRAQTKSNKDNAGASNKRQRTTKSGSRSGDSRGKRGGKRLYEGNKGDSNSHPSGAGSGKFDISTSKRADGTAHGSSPRTRDYRKQLVIATAQANAARAECASLQRMVDESQRERVMLRRRLDQMQSCLEQICNTLGNDTWQIFQSSFGVLQGSGSFLVSDNSVSRRRSTANSSDLFEIGDAFFDDQDIDDSSAMLRVNSINSLDGCDSVSASKH